MNTKEIVRNLKPLKTVDKVMFAGTAFALDKVLNTMAAAFPAFKGEVAKKNIKVQMKLRDNSFGRLFIFSDGRVSARTGIYPGADVEMVFETWEIARKLTFVIRDQMDFVNAAKNNNLQLLGDDEDSDWFSGLLLKVFAAPVLYGGAYGTKMPNGEMRYVNGTNGGAVFVYVKNGRIVRITPIDFDKDDPDPWVITAKGKKFSPPKRSTVSSHTMSLKSLVYSPDRILYPMKRVDFDPNGERHPENRGTSGYERISWEEATDIVANEIMRVRKEYGAGTVFHTSGSHHTWGNVGYYTSCTRRFFNCIGATFDARNPDSWEGFAWGAVHHYGGSARNGGAEYYGTVEDCLQNAELIVFWSADPEVTSGVYGAAEGTIRRAWMKELGIEAVHIDPFFNCTASVFKGTWIVPRPGTDTAIALAIAHQWIVDGTYDKDYIERRTLGFDVWKRYLLGEDDGIPKDVHWQAKESGIPARIIKALAKKWASVPTYLAAGALHSFGGAGRQAYATEWASAMVCLTAMQGWGKPGVNFGCLQHGTPLDTHFWFPGYAEGGMSGDYVATGAGVHAYNRMPQSPSVNSNAQGIPRIRIPEAIMNKETQAHIAGVYSQNSQFPVMKYPLPGHNPVKMYYKFGGSHFGTQPESNRFINMYRTDSLEFVVNQAIWMEGETRFADVILPACTNFERWDIGEAANCGGYIEKAYLQNNYRVIHMQHKCIEPLGESKPDFEIYGIIANKLGLGQVYNEGNSDFDWCKRIFESSDLPSRIDWLTFLQKGYYVVPPLPEDRRDPVSYRWFYEGKKKDTPELTPLPSESYGRYNEGLQTQSGLFEFESLSLKRFAADDEERPPIVKYKPSWEGPRSELFKKYPIQLVSTHPRHSFHTMQDGKQGFMNEVSDHRLRIDGFDYWICRMHPHDAEKRGLKSHDIIEIFNDRGSVLCALEVTSRIPIGLIHSHESCGDYRPVGVPGKSPDRNGCINTLTPGRTVSKHAHGIAPNSCLVQVRKWVEPEDPANYISDFAKLKGPAVNSAAEQELSHNAKKGRN
ncbi:MAG: molybdopterin-dependent oxidoreductase [Clostridiales Family XIII bacterium]|jgi:trimethylamine-N-oxide reductase (cytochrome c)|nr:molybdopterin-dependent oxidoreductase [Clostridiales Family XIII bacterium]